jgi:hypothetical protein
MQSYTFFLTRDCNLNNNASVLQPYALTAYVLLQTKSYVITDNSQLHQILTAESVQN